MFFKSLVKTISNTSGIFNNNGFSNVNPNLVQYFKNEYGTDWQNALNQHIHKKSIKNDKKAA